MSWPLIFKSLRDRWKVSSAWAAVIVVLASVQMYIYPSVRESGEAMNEFLKIFPKEFLAMFRIEDYTSGVGFLGTELYSMMIPFVFIALGATWGAWAGADEEERGTSEILYALPIRRTSVLLSKMVAAWLIMLAVAIVAVSVITLGGSIVDLDLKDVQLIAATTSCFGIGIFFHGLALAASAATARKGAALGAAVALGLLSFLIFSLAPLVDTFDNILPLNPFEWALGEKPLKTGFDWPGLSWLIGGGCIAYAVALVSINRRDLDA